MTRTQQKPTTPFVRAMPHHPRQEDDDEPLNVTQEDLRWLREQRRQDEHAKWLRGQIRVLYPWVIGGVSALVAAVLWIKDHVKF